MLINHSNPFTNFTSLQNFLDNEQLFHNRDLYRPAFSRKVFENDLSVEYHPGSRNYFKLPYFLIPIDGSEHCRISDGYEELLDYMIEEQSGIKYRPFFIHPTSVDPLSAWIGSKYLLVNAKDSPYFATPTSSFRSLLVWKDCDFRPFFVKVSILGNIAAGSRHIDWFSAVGQWESSEAFYLSGSKASNLLPIRDVAAFGLTGPQPFTLPSHLEVFIGSRDITTFGIVIREVPECLLTGVGNVVSFVALTSRIRKPKPYLLELWESSGLSLKRFLLERLIQPLYESFADLCFNQGIVVEPHCQNTLLELDSQGHLTGRFFYRDFDLTFLDRSRFPFKHPALWKKHITSRPDRISPDRSINGRDGISKLFYHHFLANLVAPCLALGVSEKVLSKEDAQEILTILTNQVAEDLRKNYPACNQGYLKEDQDHLPGMDFLSLVHRDEIPVVLTLLKTAPDLSNYIHVPLVEKQIETGEWFKTESKSIVLINENIVQGLWTPTN